MRKLTASQKKILDQTMIEDKTIGSWDDLPLEVVEKLEAINDTEILWSETNRYIMDKRTEQTYL